MGAFDMIGIGLRGYRRRGAVWSPSNDPNFKLQYRPDVGNVTLDGSDVTAFAAITADVDANRDLVPSDTGREPTWTASDADGAGQPSLTFGVNDELIAGGTFAVEIAQPFMALVVFKPGDNTKIRTAVDGQSSGQRAQIGAALTSGNARMYAGSAVVESAVVVSSGLHAVLCVFNGASSKIYIDNFTTENQIGNPGTDGVNYVRLGQNAAALSDYALEGKIFDVVYRTGVPDAAVRTRYAKYCARYGLVIA